MLVDLCNVGLNAIPNIEFNIIIIIRLNISGPPVRVRQNAAVQQERACPYADSRPQQDVHRHQRNAGSAAEYGQRSQGASDQLAEVWESLRRAAERLYPSRNVDSDRFSYPMTEAL